MGATVALLAALSPARVSLAQEQKARVLTLEAAVQEALANHPRIAAVHAAENEAAARVGEARTTVLPSAGVSAQFNRSTGNTPPGAFFPTQGFPPISGSPRGKTLDDGVFQTGVSVWANWDVLSIARQAAAVDAALAARAEAFAAIDAQELEIAYRAADGFLLLLEGEETVRAAKATVDRAEVLLTTTKPLVDQSLRPGVDAVRAQAELANAQTQLARAEQAREVRRTQLAEALGNAALRVEAMPGPLLEPADLAPRPASPNGEHPAIVQATAAVMRAEQGKRLVRIEYLPRVDLVAALWARGSGYYQSPGEGTVPDIPNWAACLVVTWPILDIPRIRARNRAADAQAAVAASRRDEVALAIAGELASASAILDGALRVARQTPATLASARAAEQQAIARYRSGLAPVVDVADAERVLAQAEFDDAVARLEVSRAKLLVARASGDLEPFLAEARTRGGS